MIKFEDYKVDVPEGKIGKYEVKKFVVPELSFQGSFRAVPAGEYTGLYRDSYLIMSDTPDEVRDHLEFIQKAKGNVFIGGLGIGMVLKALCLSEAVDHITVIEKSPEVIQLAKDHYISQFPGKVTIIKADLMNYKPKNSDYWNHVWLDIWDDIDEDNLKDMKKLSSRFSKHTSWVDSWSRKLLESKQQQPMFF
jgi:hypothetical protein